MHNRGGDVHQERNGVDVRREPLRQLELYRNLLRGCTDALAVLLVKDIVAELELQLGTSLLELAPDQI